MTKHEIAKICRWLGDGGKLLLRRDAAGNPRLKILHGPMRVFAHRFTVTDEELEQLKKRVVFDPLFTA